MNNDNVAKEVISKIIGLIEQSSDKNLLKLIPILQEATVDKEKEEYKKKYLDPIKNIEMLLNTDKEKASEEFKKYINDIKILGEYSTKTWKEGWSTDIKVLSERSKEFGCIEKFIKILEDAKKSYSVESEEEVIDYVYAQMYFFYLDNKKFQEGYENYIQKLIEKYETNRELKKKNFLFKGLLGAYYTALLKSIDPEQEVEQGKNAENIEAKEKKKKKDEERLLKGLKGIEIYQELLRNHASSEMYLFGRFELEREYLRRLALMGENEEVRFYLDKASKYLDTLFKSEKMSLYLNKYGSELNILKELIEDQVSILEKIDDEEKRILKEVRSQTDLFKSQMDAERNRIIEILGFFSAIIAFIFSTVSIGKMFSFQEAIWFIIALGCILVLFVWGLSMLFSGHKIGSRSERWYKNKNFWMAVLPTIILVAIIICGKNRQAQLTTTINSISTQWDTTKTTKDSTLIILRKTETKTDSIKK